MIPYSCQDISEADVSAVVSALNDKMLTQGSSTILFERAVAEYCGAAHAKAVTNATSALHLACLAAGVGPGDFVWTSPNSFVASANCARFCGADVEFVDINPITLGIDIDLLAEKLANAKTRGGLPKVIVVVHFAGQAPSLGSLETLAERYGFVIIEDASHALGAVYCRQAPDKKKFKSGGTVGSSKKSLCTVFSFHPVKMITTGEGGMVVSNDSSFMRKIELLRSHGITRDDSNFQRLADGKWYYEQQFLGVNYRMTDIQAALGLSQLKRLNQFVLARREVAANYYDSLAPLANFIKLPPRRFHDFSSYHLFVIRLRSQFSYLRGRLFDYLRSSGIGVQVHYIPIYKQPYYESLYGVNTNCPEMEKYYETAISLPNHTKLEKIGRAHV